MRLVALVAVALLAGCFGQGFSSSTPCKPLEAVTGDALQVQLRAQPGAEGVPPFEGTCVAMKRNDDSTIIVAARVDAAGRASLPVPTEDVWVTWDKPDPRDRYCGYQGFAVVQAGARSAELEIGKVCS